MKRLLFFHFFLRDGGVEKVLVNLANGFVREEGYQVGFAAMDLRGHFLSVLDPRIATSDFGLRPFKMMEHIRCMIRLAQEIRRFKPDVILTGIPAANITVIVAYLLSGRWRTKTVISEHTPVRMWIGGRKGRRLLKIFLGLAIFCFYRIADVIVTVSDYLAEDSSKVVMLPRSRFQRIYNPVIDEALLASAEIAPSHRWMGQTLYPLILSAGRLAKEKNFPLLLNAFHEARKQHPMLKLIILGDGPERGTLESLIAQLGLQDCVDLPGFHANPYAFMRHADLLVLSSDFEGLPTVLIEALACGCPVVSTSTPSGPKEILAGGRYGLLTPVQDRAAMTHSILDILDHPDKARERTQAFQREMMQEFTVATSMRHYRQMVDQLIVGR